MEMDQEGLGSVASVALPAVYPDTPPTWWPLPDSPTAHLLAHTDRAAPVLLVNSFL